MFSFVYYCNWQVLHIFQPLARNIVLFPLSFLCFFLLIDRFDIIYYYEVENCELIRTIIICMTLYMHASTKNHAVICSGGKALTNIQNQKLSKLNFN